MKPRLIRVNRAATGFNSLSRHRLSREAIIFRNNVMIYLMNTTVIPHGADGAWTMESLAPSSARHLAQRSSEQGRLTSAVGHASSAEAMAAVLQIPVEMNRITVAPQPGDQFLCLRLHSRPPEGVVLDLPQLEEIGFSWALLSYLG